MNEILVELAGQLDSLLWVGVLVFVISRFEKPLSEVIRSLRLKSLKAGEFSAEFEQAESFMRQASTQAAASATIKVDSTLAKKKVQITTADRTRVLQRAAARIDVLAGGRVLWMDDEPDNNRLEREMFEALGVHVELATSLDTAREALQSQHNYDLVLSEVKQEQAEFAGLELLAWLREQGNTTPLIFYITEVDLEKPVPVGAFGLTNRPDEVLHLAIDALERSHG